MDIDQKGKERKEILQNKTDKTCQDIAKHSMAYLKGHGEIWLDVTRGYLGWKRGCGRELERNME